MTRKDSKISPGMDRISTTNAIVILGFWVTGLICILTIRIRKESTHLADALTDLKQAVTDLNTSVSNELAAIGTALQNASQNSGGISQADAEGIVTQIRDLQAKVDQETSTLAAPVQPTPPVA